jgi:hypothetical protein
MLTSSLDVHDENRAMQYERVCAFLNKPLTKDAMTELGRKFSSKQTT